MHPNGGVTRASVTLGGTTVSAHVVCSSKDRFNKREGRSRAVLAMIGELDKINSDIARYVKGIVEDKFKDDLEWLFDQIL